MNIAIGCAETFAERIGNGRQPRGESSNAGQIARLAALGARMAEVAHESRNALQRAQSNLDLLSLELTQQQDLLTLTARTQRALDDIQRLFREIRETVVPPRNLHHGDVLRLCENVWADLEVSHRDKPIDFVESVRCGDTCCDIDDAKLSQVFRNIFENAISACPNPGRIEVECGDTEVGSVSALEVCVRDNGCGFSSSDLERIFEPFFTTKASGTGLGMPIAKQIVADHGGRLDARNSQNSGAEFVLTLPRFSDCNHASNSPNNANSRECWS